MNTEVQGTETAEVNGEDVVDVEPLTTEAPDEASIEEVVEESKTVTIAADNPSKEEMEALVAQIKADYDYDVDVVSTRFSFKKNTDKETGIELIREAVELAVPYPSLVGIVNALGEGGLQAELIREACNSYVNDQVRALLNDGEEGRKLNAGNFPIEQLSWEFISKLPKAQRGTGIAKEIWEGFIKDYVEVMPAATGKSLEAIGKQAKVLANKFAQNKTNKQILEYMIGMLGIYANNSPNASDYVKCVEFELSKIDTFLNITEETLLEALM